MPLEGQPTFIPQTPYPFQLTVEQLNRVPLQARFWLAVCTWHPKFRMSLFSNSAYTCLHLWGRHENLSFRRRTRTHVHHFERRSPAEFRDAEDQSLNRACACPRGRAEKWSQCPRTEAVRLHS